MHKKEKFFLISFIFSLVILSFFLGNSITSWVTKSMYCSSEGCKAYCDNTQECSLDEACCQKESFGICEPKNECEKLYEPNFEFENPDIDTSIKYPISEKPSQINQPWFYFFLILIVLFIGFFYLFNKLKK
ncbi:hypothetical protein GF327_06175 [Candidatus Woesearchaeota archaeon]|nr:hypothetical protein [Candidatus Woesearchaeota archaeon]